ncbi:MAG: type II secretion system minor pseudopilin GspK [Betaproteobacteria bacterium]
MKRARIACRRGVVARQANALAQRGAAIVLAMLMAALAATIAATLLWQQQRWINDTEHRRNQVQAQALAMAGVQWARQIVFETAPANAPTHLGQPWALRLPGIPLENGSISGYITDAQARINVNNLALGSTQAGTRAALDRLLAALSLPPTLANAITDWVDNDSQVSEPGGAEDAWYLSQSVPGLSANAPVRRTSELLAVRGLRAQPVVLERLRPFVTALDAPSPVNVNTADAQVLSAITGLDRTAALALVAQRTQKPFSSVADFRARLPRPDVVVDETSVDVRSNWFEVTIEAHQGDTMARARALLHRATNASDWPSVVWQTVE